MVYTPAGQDPSIGKGVLIASYAWEQDSMAYSMLDERERIAEALEDLAKIHPEARETFEFGISHDWALDRHGGGIGPLFRPFEMTSRFYDDVVRPVGRVWFANDACDRRARRWIEGAIAAAVKNAYAIHAGMRDALPEVARGSMSDPSSAGLARGAPGHDARRPRDPGHRHRGPDLPRARTAKRVVVIGAGLAGLVAAFELKRQGHRRQPCSRRRTASAAGSTRCARFAPGLYAEAGGDAHPAGPRPHPPLLRAASACRCGRS